MQQNLQIALDENKGYWWRNREKNWRRTFFRNGELEGKKLTDFEFENCHWVSTWLFQQKREIRNDNMNFPRRHCHRWIGDLIFLCSFSESVWSCTRTQKRNAKIWVTVPPPSGPQYKHRKYVCKPPRWSNVARWGVKYYAAATGRTCSQEIIVEHNFGLYCSGGSVFILCLTVGV